MVYRGYIGTYSKGENGGIFRFKFDDGRFSAEPACGVENPSFLCFAGEGMLAVSETSEYEGKNGGSLAYIEIHKDGQEMKLIEKSRKATSGKDPCYVDCVEYKGKIRAFSANYSEGTASMFEIENGELSECVKTIVHTGSGKDPARQEMAHIHCTVITPDKKYAAVCDLGTDKIAFYDLKGNPVSEVQLPEGSGPRHIVFKEEYAYAVTELSSEIYAYTYEDGRLSEIGSYPLLPEGFSGFSNAAAIKISPDGKFLAASNRGHNSLAVFRFAGKGRLDFVCRRAVEGGFPRDFAFTPDSQWILCANQLSEDITVFKVNQGIPEFTGIKYRLPKPVMILFDK